MNLQGAFLSSWELKRFRSFQHGRQSSGFGGVPWGRGISTLTPLPTTFWDFPPTVRNGRDSQVWPSRSGTTALSPTPDLAHSRADLLVTKGMARARGQHGNHYNRKPTDYEHHQDRVYWYEATGPAHHQMPSSQNKVGQGEVLFLPISGWAYGTCLIGTRSQHPLPRSLPWLPRQPGAVCPSLNSHHPFSPLHNPLIHFSLLCRTFLASS